MATNISSESSGDSLVFCGSTPPRQEVKTLVDMGFTAAAAKNALEQCGYDVNLALAMYIF